MLLEQRYLKKLFLESAMITFHRFVCLLKKFTLRQQINACIKLSYMKCVLMTNNIGANLRLNNVILMTSIICSYFLICLQYGKLIRNWILSHWLTTFSAPKWHPQQEIAFFRLRQFKRAYLAATNGFKTTFIT